MAVVHRLLQARAGYAPIAASAMARAKSSDGVQAPPWATSAGCIDDRCIRIGARQRWSQGRLGERELPPAKPFRVETAVVIESENGERAPGDADRRATGDFDDNGTHSHALPGEMRQTIACGIPKHRPNFALAGL